MAEVYFSGQQKPGNRSRNYFQCFLKDSQTNIKCCQKTCGNIDILVSNFFLLSGSTPDLGQFPFKYMPLKPSKYSWGLLCTLHDNTRNAFELLCFSRQLSYKIKIQVTLFSSRQKLIVALSYQTSQWALLFLLFCEILYLHFPLQCHFLVN